jgi:hypothetical protein
MWVGTNDALFPLKVIRATRDALKDGGFSPELTEISGHTHWYYDRAADINKKAWAFLRAHPLSAEPKYQRFPGRADVRRTGSGGGIGSVGSGSGAGRGSGVGLGSGSGFGSGSG